MFIVFTKPNKFTKTYTEACQIAEDYYQSTGEIVAVERSEHHGNYVYNSPNSPVNCISFMWNLTERDAKAIFFTPPN